MNIFLSILHEISNPASIGLSSAIPSAEFILLFYIKENHFQFTSFIHTNQVRTIDNTRIQSKVNQTSYTINKWAAGKRSDMRTQQSTLWHLLFINCALCMNSTRISTPPGLYIVPFIHIQRVYLYINHSGTIMKSILGITYSSYSYSSI